MVDRAKNENDYWFILESQVECLNKSNKIMKNELSKEDQERIEKRAALYSAVDTFNDFSSFIDGANYEHPIAKKEGFNEAH